MKILITGASGLIGHYLLDELTQYEYEVYYISRNKLPFIKDNFHHIRLDLASSEFTDSLPNDIDCIYHLAQSNFYQDFPLKAEDVFNVNLNSTHQLLTYGQKIGISNFIYASSGGVYNNFDGNIDEKSSIKKHSKLGHYLATKFTSEIFASQFSNYFNTQIMRLFFAYGPRQHGRMLIPRLINSVYDGKSIKVSGTKGVSINPIYASDAAKALLSSLNLENSNIFNIAGSQEVSLLELINKIEKKLGRKAEIIHEESQDLKLIGDIHKMAAELHKPEIFLDEGLGKVIEKNYPHS